MGKAKKGAKKKGNTKGAKEQAVPPLAQRVHKMYDSAHPVRGFQPDQIRLAEVEGRGRGYLARHAIPAGSFIHRSSGFIFSPTAPAEPFLAQVPADKQLSVHLLAQFVRQLESTPTGSMSHLHQWMKSTVWEELEPKSLETWQGSQTEESMYISELFCQASGRPLTEKEKWARLGLVAVVNSHRVHYDFSQEASQDWGVFPSASFFNHSCWPNCTAFYSKHSGMSELRNRTFVFLLLIFLWCDWRILTGEFFIRTIQDVAEGEELTINYVSIYLPQWKRNEQLMLQYEFTCRCAKCLRDGNPIDEYLEAYQCPTPECSGAYLLETLPSYERQTTSKEGGESNRISASNLRLRCVRCGHENKEQETIDSHRTRMETIMREMNALQSPESGQLSLEQMGTKINEIDKMAQDFIHPYNSYSFQVKMARAKFHKYCDMLEISTYEENKEDEAVMNRRRYNLERLIDALEQVNKFCLLIYPKNHPQRAHILLDLGHVSALLDRPALGRKYTSQALRSLTISRGEQIAKEQLQMLSNGN